MTQDKIEYIQNLYAIETTDMQAARERITENDFSIFIPPIEGKLMSLLVTLADIKSIVEIGTLGGYSTLWLAQNLPQDGHIFTCEHDEKRAALAQQTLAPFPNITLVKGDANETLISDIQPHGLFDMIFIDADKPSYLNYLDWAEKNIRKGGLIIADDTLLKGSVYMKELPPRIRQSTKDTVTQFNERLANTQNYHSILLPTQAGLTIAVKKF